MPAAPEDLRRAALLGGQIDDATLCMRWQETPWDSRVLGAPVVTIDSLVLRDAAAGHRVGQVLAGLQAAGVRLASCRLGHASLVESMLLEDLGFRFIEMIHQPVHDRLEALAPIGAAALCVRPASQADLPALLAIAGEAFSHERFHLDPRLPRAAADLRYQNWVRSALDHPSQCLQVLCEGPEIVAFFVTEQRRDGCCYWHLNAVARQARGRGLGRRAWATMLAQARTAGAREVRSSVVARNVRVLDLYASLGFRLAAPSMTFHWVAPG